MFTPHTQRNQFATRKIEIGRTGRKPSRTLRLWPVATLGVIALTAALTGGRQPIVSPALSLNHSTSTAGDNVQRADVIDDIIALLEMMLGGGSPPPPPPPPPGP